MGMMGDVYSGIPPQLALDMQDKFELQHFVETGTLVGKTAKWAAEHFEEVYTIECSYKFYILAMNEIGTISNVRLLYGFSQQVLSSILPSLTGSALIWLDAHWSRDLGYANFEAVLCPVLKEIEAISHSDQDHVILVDDLRLFGEQAGWPSKDTVKQALEGLGKIVTYSTDVLVAVPNGKS
jgi:hypothetical protein